ncbi:hypothetical protein ABMA28_009611 [Loxostege sticticalis]|uniref:Uncharacterized protein n=1 Tax=Loxostege sticticalis TaxID=481309 RepID=A0ABD0SAW2_LOXSC
MVIRLLFTTLDCLGKARNGGGRSFQHFEAANLNEPRKATTSEADRPGHHRSYERRCGPVSSKRTSREACGTPRAHDEKAGDSSGSVAR